MSRSYARLAELDDRLHAMRAIAIGDAALIKVKGQHWVDVFSLRYMPLILQLAGPLSKQSGYLSSHAAYLVVCDEIIDILKGGSDARIRSNSTGP